MPFKTITSQENETIKKIGKLKNAKHRKSFGLFVAEGERSVRDSLSADTPLETIVMTETFYEKNKEAYVNFPCIVTTEKIFSALCDTKTPQGILSVMRLPEERDTFSGSRYIYCDGIQDPGNAGTIIRSADAFGFDGVIFSKNSVDAFSPKVIRSSMGSIFHISVYTDKETDFLIEKQKEGFFLSATALHKKSVALSSATRKERQIYIIGNEGNGVTDGVLSLSDELVHIPMKGKAESLNAGIAASILMYEVSRHE